MDARIKELWTAALRSGEFEQGRYVLRSAGNEFCCLGVLCELAAREGVIPEATPTGHEGCYQYGKDGSELYLPREVAAWAGLHESDPQLVTVKYGGTRLSHRNDALDSFAEIADLIEEYL